ncbi:hypothetical protein [Enterobacter hormaechei]|nr:hypothetical protein [Enterobacter hormaechei]
MKTVIISKVYVFFERCNEKLSHDHFGKLFLPLAVGGLMLAFSGAGRFARGKARRGRESWMLECRKGTADPFLLADFKWLILLC